MSERSESNGLFKGEHEPNLVRVLLTTGGRSMVNQMAGQEVTGVDHLYSPETSDQFIVALREMKTIPNGEERRRMVAGLMSIGLSEHQASELMNGIAEMAIMSGTMRMRPRQID